MEVWEMTQAEFVGSPLQPDGDRQPGSDLPWNDYKVAMDGEPPDPAHQRLLTGRNSPFQLSRLLRDPKSFMIEDMRPSIPQLVAFYKADFLLVEETCRGQWLAEELILAAEKARGIRANKTRDVNRSSVKSFTRAHELAVRRAHAALETVRVDILAQYGLKPI